MITVKSLGAQVHGKHILHDLTFCIERSESVAIVGPNGAGKSTLLRHLAGLKAPSMGDVLFDGRSVFQLSQQERARKLSILMQKPEAAQHYTELEVVKMARYPYLRRFQPEGARDRAVVQEAMEKTCTIHLQDRMLNQMSGGELQRVFLARALAQEPEILLLDEPTTYLDVFHQHELLGMLQQEKQQSGLTWVAVLHDLNLAAQYCDRMLLLAEGRVVAFGTPREILVPELVERVYGVKAVVVENAELPFPQLVFLGAMAVPEQEHRGREASS